jgi:hypothetical protein
VLIGQSLTVVVPSIDKIPDEILAGLGAVIVNCGRELGGNTLE